ncbi:MAG: twin-arginine translocation signal domain-containing protein [Actinomycetota bacterium]|nr:twin-arginine translocation signal domain-containing protein [Actinomycetota bacterium]
MTTVVPATGTSLTDRLVSRAATVLQATTSRRSFLARSAVVGSALAVAPGRFILRPGTAYASVCGDAATCSAGYTVFCCTINNGINQCPPGTFVGGWWKADNAGFCGGRARYYIDCQGSCTNCTAGCGGYNSFCNSGCVNCSCGCGPAGQCDQRRVCCNYFRYGQCRQDIACGGPVACRVVTCTPPWQLDSSCSTASATDNATVNHSAPCLTATPTAIDQHYYDLGGPQGFLGQPVGPEQRAPDQIGAFRYFQGGGIYWTPSTGAREVHGAILGRWAGLGYEHSVLGYPVTDESPAIDRVGRYNHFQAGSIFWSPGTGAHEAHGAIRERWAAMGWERGVLGYPVTDESGAADGVGRFNHFQGGSIFWTPGTGAHEAHGAIRAKWAALGWERGVLGYPTTDESGAADGVGRFNDFQGGSVYWTADTAAHEVHGPVRDKWTALRREAGPLGYPVTDTTATPSGTGFYSDFAKGGTQASGSIYWRTGTAAAFAVRGPIRAKWLSLGAEASSLGYPTSDEKSIAIGAQSDFEHGTITYNSTTGEVVVVVR